MGKERRQRERGRRKEGGERREGKREEEEGGEEEGGRQKHVEGKECVKERKGGIRRKVRRRSEGKKGRNE